MSEAADLIDRVIVREDGCWDVKGKRGRPRFKDWYTQLSSATEGTTLAFRAIYEILVGPVPKKHDLHHTCPNRGCVNPGHLQPLTRSQHMLLHKEMARGY